MDEGRYATKAESDWEYRSNLLSARNAYIDVAHLNDMNAYSRIVVAIETNNPQRFRVGAGSISVELFDLDGNLVPAGAPPPRLPKAITVDRITRSIQTGDERRLSGTLSAARAVHSSRGGGEIATLNFLLDLWNERADLYPELDWVLLNRESVRVGLALVLLDAYEQQGFSIPVDAVLEQLRSSARNSIEEDYVRLARRALSDRGDPGDMEFFLQLASSSNETEFMNGVMGLLLYCSSEADRVLLDFSKTLPLKQQLYVKEKMKDTEYHCRCRREDCSLPSYEFKKTSTAYRFQQVFQYPPVHKLSETLIEKVRIDIQIDGKPFQVERSFEISERRQMKCCLVPGP